MGHLISSMLLGHDTDTSQLLEYYFGSVTSPCCWRSLENYDRMFINNNDNNFRVYCSHFNHNFNGPNICA